MMMKKKKKVEEKEKGRRIVDACRSGRLSRSFSYERRDTHDIVESRTARPSNDPFHSLVKRIFMASFLLLPPGFDIFHEHLTLLTAHRHSKLVNKAAPLRGGAHHTRATIHDRLHWALDQSRLLSTPRTLTSIYRAPSFISFAQTSIDLVTFARNRGALFQLLLQYSMLGDDFSLHFDD